MRPLGSRARLTHAEALERHVAQHLAMAVANVAVPVLTQLREALNRLRERELAAALKRLPDLTPAQRVAVDHLSRALMNRFMHEPSMRLRAAVANGRASGIVDDARYLFALDDARETDADAP